MNSKLTVLKRKEDEDVIYEDDTFLNETPTDTVPDEKDDSEEETPEKTESDGDDTKTLDDLIDKLPDSFPRALPEIKSSIAPIVAKLDGGLFEYYVERVKKKTKAPKRAILDEIEIAKRETTSGESAEDEDKEMDPEVQRLSEEIGKDPFLFKRKINIVNQLGVIGEKKALGLYFATLDSRLIPMGLGGSEALALKNSGHHGAGKSYPMSICLSIYPKSAYHLITSGSSKSLYNIEGGLKHKALILIEALHLEAYNGGDSELAYSIRSLLSEGNLIYQYTGYDEKGKKVTIVNKLEGPTSLLTTTVKGRLEPQLEDRLITVSPDTSTNQTKDIVSMTGDQAAGTVKEVDEKTIKAWKQFHRSLEPLYVVIPFAGKISDYVKGNGSLPVAARRAFKRVISTTKTVALLHQHQRRREEKGRIIAEMEDYTIALQLINESFMESLGQGKKYTNKRIRLIEKYGPITPRKLSEMVEVTVPALSPWIKERVEKGILTWCDEKGDAFPDEETLKKAKHSGNGFIRVTHPTGLPTPYQLTKDPKWDEGGELYVSYHLDLEDGDIGSDVLSDDNGMSNDLVERVEDVYGNREGPVESLNPSLNTMDESYGIDNKQLSDDAEEGVKVIRSIPHKEVMKMMRESSKNQKEYDPNDPEAVKLYKEIGGLLRKTP